MHYSLLQIPPVASLLLGIIFVFSVDLGIVVGVRAMEGYTNNNMCLCIFFSTKWLNIASKMLDSYSCLDGFFCPKKNCLFRVLNINPKHGVLNQNY